MAKIAPGMAVAGVVTLLVMNVLAGVVLLLAAGVAWVIEDSK